MLKKQDAFFLDPEEFYFTCNVVQLRKLSLDVIGILKIKKQLSFTEIVNEILRETSYHKKTINHVIF